MEKIQSALKSKTIYQSAITSVSTIVNGLLGVAFYILVARVLGPVEFGILTVAITTLTLISDIANVGIDTGIVKFVGQYFGSDRDKALKFLKLGIEVKFIVGVIIFLLGILLVPLMAINVLGKPELIIPLKIAIVGAFGMLLFTFATSSLQAIQKFWTWGMLNIFTNALRLAVIAIFIYLNIFSLNLTLISYIACIFLGFFVALIFLPNFFKTKNEFSLAKEFIHYNKWVALFILIAAISGRLDTYLATKIISLREVGIYGVATGISLIGAQIVAGITTVVAPKLASFNSSRKAIVYLKKLQILVLALGVAGVIIGIPLSRVFVPFFYGTEYLSSLGPLSILLISQAIFLISIPAHSAVIYYFSYPKLFVYISLIHLVIIGGLGWILISKFGYTGAAITVLVGNISNFVIPAAWVIRKFQ